MYYQTNGFEVFKAGDIVWAKRGKSPKKLAYILIGDTWSNGRLSNHFTWAYIKPDGTLGRKEHGYNHSDPKMGAILTKASGYKVVIRVVKK